MKLPTPFSCAATTLAAIALCGAPLVKAVDAFDPATNHLTLDAVTVNGTTYQNVSVVVNRFTLLGVDAGLAQADAFDPATNLLTLGAVTYQGATFGNVRVVLNNYTLLGTGQATVNYALLGSVARTSILSGNPVTANATPIAFQYQSGVPQGNRDLIQAGVNNFASRFSTILGYTSKPINIVGYSTLAGGLALAKTYDPTNASFLADMTSTFSQQTDPAAVACLGMGGFSVGYERLIVIGAPCFNSSANQPPVATHELTHEVQSGVLEGANPRSVAPVWLVEGQAQVVGAATSIQNGQSNFVWARATWAAKISPNRTLANLSAMEGETRNSADPLVRLSEYNVGAGVMEYLIARSGFQKSLDVLQSAKALANGASVSAPQIMVNFRTAFQATYGQSLDAFYQEVMPYINYLATHSPTASASSTESGTRFFLTESCHGLVDATLQQQVAGNWVDLAAAKGWDNAPNPPCAAGTFRPWTIADAPKGTTLRWHVYSAGSFDWYSTPYVY